MQYQDIGISESKKASLFVRFDNKLYHNLFTQHSSGIGISDKEKKEEEVE